MAHDAKEKEKENTNALKMHRNHHLRPHQPHHLHPLRRVHRDHEQAHARGRDRRPAQVHEHEVDVVRVAGGDGVELGDEEGVAGYVDAEAWFGVRGVWGGGGDVIGELWGWE